MIHRQTHSLRVKIGKKGEESIPGKMTLLNVTIAILSSNCSNLENISYPYKVFAQAL